jgi:cytidine deaminase
VGAVSAEPDATSDPTPDPTPDLVAAAVAVQQVAYAPYSRYRVGVAVRTTSGSVHVGCNVENASYPLGTCAEAGAIAAMVAAGDRDVVEVVVVTDGDVPGSPCGGCRQRLREFAAPDVLVHSLTPGAATVLTRSVAELLPDSFGPEFLLRSPSTEIE